MFPGAAPVVVYIHNLSSIPILIPVLSPGEAAPGDATPRPSQHPPASSNRLSQTPLLGLESERGNENGFVVFLARCQNGRGHRNWDATLSLSVFEIKQVARLPSGHTGLRHKAQGIRIHTSYNFGVSMRSTCHRLKVTGWW